MSVNQGLTTVLGFRQPHNFIQPNPIISVRNPTVTDKAPLGTIWVNKTANDSFILTSVVANVATWVGAGGGAGNFNTITVTTTGTFGTTVTAGTGITSTAGNITATAGNVAAGAAVTAATTITAGTGITSTAGNITATAGNVAAGAAVTAVTTVTAGTGLIATTGGVTATAGNIVATAGNVQIPTAGAVSSTGLILGAALIQVTTGVGAPGFNAPIGSLYLNSTAATATTRLYIATSAAGAWTNITCAA